MDNSLQTRSRISDGQNSILVIDDEEHFLTSMRFVLSQLGYTNVRTCSDSRSAMDMLREHTSDVVLLDISMPHITGTELLATINSDFPDIPVIMITAIIEMKTAVGCMQHGAFNYLLKPCEAEWLARVLKNACDLSESQQENTRLRDVMLAESSGRPDIFKAIITHNNTMLRIFSYIEAVAPNRQPVLITGETGTGKELIARAIHDAGMRK